MEKSCDEYLTSMREIELSPGKERFNFKDLEIKPRRKFAIGSRNGVGEAYAQFLQTTYLDCQTSNYKNFKYSF